MMFDNLKTKLAERKTRLVMLATTLMGLVASVTAVNGPLYNATEPIITAVTTLFDPILSLVVAIFPILLVLAVVGLIVGILDGVLSRIKL